MTQATFDREQISAALDRIGASPVFARSPQLKRLLEYLVHCALAGNGAPKEYTIAVEALGRPENFDPEHDSIVRVQAARLRRALESYYTASGRDDPGRLVLPLGCYALAWESRPAVTAPRRRRSSWLLRTGIGVTGIAALFVVIYANTAWREAASAALSLNHVFVVPPHNGLPTIVLEPPNGAGVSIDDMPKLVGLRRQIAAAFARFENVNIIYVPRGQAQERPDPQLAGRRVYGFATTVVSDSGGLRLQFHLIDRADRTVFWARSFALSAGSEGAVGPDVVPSLATLLLQPFGVVTSRERAFQLHTGGGDPRYRCLLQAMDALRAADLDSYVAARGCLERVIAADPTYTLAYSYLASLLNRYYQYSASERPDLLDAALAAARRAVEINPASARAYFALFITRYNMREFAAGDAAWAEASARNENDLLMRSEYGGRLICRGRIDEGMAILDAVERAFPVHACTHDLYAFLSHYVRGDTREAHRRAHELACPSYPYAFLAKALGAVQAGEIDDARAHLEAVAALMPGWRTDPRAMLHRMIADEAIVDRIVRDLAVAVPGAGHIH